MSANLGNSAKLYDDVAFRNRVRAAMVETAGTVIGTQDTGSSVMSEQVLIRRLAQRVVTDADAYTSAFARLAADQAGDYTDQEQIDDDAIRGAVLNLWSTLAASVATL